MTTHETKGYVARHVSEVTPVSCPCGSSTRLVTPADTPVASLHVTHITDSQLHYHAKTDELYYVIEGHGSFRVGPDTLPLTPGLALFIAKGTVHRGWGDFRAVIVPIPAFDPHDEYIVSE